MGIGLGVACIACLIGYLFLIALVGDTLNELKESRSNKRKLLLFRILFHTLIFPAHYILAVFASAAYLFQLPSYRNRTPLVVYKDIYDNEKWGVPDTLFKKGSKLLVYIVWPALALCLLASCWFLSVPTSNY